ncbi:Flavinator of succinate dehydrogenase-domain-containing protein [Ganoderma leucocontextum]|nr:Flavinator of succinate dehydrogenase-domain-containing protein [Ganoderma leucocontextum]
MLAHIRRPSLTVPPPCRLTATTMSAAMLRLAARRCLRPTTSPVHSSSASARHINRQISTTARRAADPWLLPNMPGHLEKTTSPPGAPAPEPLPRPGESVETMRARLVYQSRKRGTLESDLLLSTFARERLGAMSEGELREFDKLMDEPDWDIYYWATGKKTPPERWEGSSVLAQLVQHVKNEGKVVRRMPDLS